MTWQSALFAVFTGIFLGWLITRNKNIDYSKIRIILPDDFRKNMRKGQLIDIRKNELFKQNRFKGSRNLKPSQLTSKYSKIRKDLPVYLYCENGKKSKRVAKKMIRKNYHEIYILEGGFRTYQNKNR